MVDGFVKKVTVVNKESGTLATKGQRGHAT